MKRVDPTTGEKIKIHGNRSSSKTNEGQMSIAIADLIKKGKEGKDNWASYKNEQFRRTYGRNMDEKDWYNYLVTYSCYCKEKDYSNQWNPMTSGTDSGNGGTGGEGGFAFDTEALNRPSEYSHVSAKNVRQIVRSMNDPNFKLEDNADIYNLHLRLMNRSPAYKSGDWKERKKILINEVVKPYQAGKYSLEFTRPTSEVTSELSKNLTGLVNKDGKMSATGLSAVLRGTPMWDAESGQKIQDIDEKAFAEEGSTIEVLGTISNNNIPKAPAPGLVAIEKATKNGNKTYFVKMKGLAASQQKDWDYGSWERSSTGIGDGFAIQFQQRPDDKSWNSSRCRNYT